MFFYPFIRRGEYPQMRNKTRKQPSGYIQPGEAVCHPRVKGKPRGQCFDTQTRRRVKASVGKQIGTGGDDLALLNQSSLPDSQKRLLKQKWFRPDAPREWKEKPDTWLTNEDIEKVMKQYEEAYPEFRFLGAVPIDFSAPDPYIRTEAGSGGGSTSNLDKCMVQEFCKVNLKEAIASGKKLLGAVFNLDPHYKGGSHWVSLVIRPTEGVYYFDSYGLPPPLQIARFMRNLTLQNPKLVLASNGRRFQYSNTECGMYSLYFIIRMLFGQDFKKYCKHRIADKYMLQLRKVLFLSS